MYLGLWIAFVALVLILLALDLFVVHRTPHSISVTEALVWTGVWIVLALTFNVAVYYLYRDWPELVGQATGAATSGGAAAIDFFAGYVIEKSLSLDNIMVFALVLTYFKVPKIYQHGVLFWGVLGALVMRGLMIAAGVALIRRFDWIVYVFGGLLLITAARLLFAKDHDVHPNRNLFVRLVRRVYPVTSDYDGPHFVSHIDGRRAVTPLLLVLIVLETTDLLFAVDSIPAVFAVTRDPFLVFTSNVFAILGLRSLYFALAGLLDRFRYLQPCLVLILAFVGVKMILSEHYPIPTSISLCVIAGVLAIGIAASIIRSRKSGAEHQDSSSGDETLPDIVTAVTNGAIRNLRRAVVTLVGATVVLVGVALLVLPGPAFIVIPAGFAILGTEFAVFRRVMHRMRRGLKNLVGK